VPTVVLGTDAFVSLAHATAIKHGLPHLPVATIPHPLGGVAPDVMVGRAASVVSAALRALTADPPIPEAVGAARIDEVEAPDDLDAFQEFAVSEGWSDGLPVLPPTRERVSRLLGGRDRDELIATLAPLDGRATREAIAINAALAGAVAEHMPIIVAAVRAVAAPEFNLNAIQCTTHPCTPLIVVNGPGAARLGIAAGPNALGNGHRANAVIGRAVRLILQNVGGARPGREDRATLGHAGKFTYCVAENEAASPWAALHVERGFAVSDTTVSVFGAEGPHNVNDHGSTSAEALLMALAGTAATPGSNNVYLGGDPLVILGPEHAQTIAASRWSKLDFKRRFWERARVPISGFSAENLARFAAITPERFKDKPPDTLVPWCPTPGDVTVVIAGGPGKHSSIVPTFGATRSVTVRVDG
jgi:hypothetical protein